MMRGNRRLSSNEVLGLVRQNMYENNPDGRTVTGFLEGTVTFAYGDDVLLRLGEAARLLYVHENTLRRWADKGTVGAYRISSRGDRRFSRNEIIDLSERMRTNGGNVLAE